MKRILAIASLAVALPVVPQQEAIAQQQAIPAAVAACYSQPTICAVVGAVAGGWILMRRGRQVLCTWDGCRPYQGRVERQPRESRIEGNENIPGSMETHAAASAEDCRKMERTFKQQGRNLKLVEARRVRNAARDGGVFQYLCIFEGEGATDDWFDEGGYRRQRRN